MTTSAIPAYDKEEEEKGLKSPALGGLKCNNYYHTSYFISQYPLPTKPVGFRRMRKKRSINSNLDIIIITIILVAV